MTTEEQLFVEELQKANQVLEAQLSVLTEGGRWKSAVDKHVLNKYETMARIISLSIKGLAPLDIVDELYMQSIAVSPRTVYKAISVRDDKDKERVMRVYYLFPEIFKTRGISDGDVLQWFSNFRIKKLHLLTEEELMKKYGINGDTIAPDNYVLGTYFNPKEAERYLAGNQ